MRADLLRALWLFVVIAALACSEKTPPPSSKSAENTAPQVPLLTPTARVQTAPVGDAGDALDDPALWVHPKDRAKSRIIGTDKFDGLEIYALDGSLVTRTSPGWRPDNVDVAYGVQVGARVLDVAGAATRGSEHGFVLWTIEPEEGRIQQITPHAIAVFGGKTPYGSTLYRRAKDGTLFFFVTDKQGEIEQYALDLRSGEVKSALVRSFTVGSQSEGCVADEEYGTYFVSEELKGIWRYDADPEAPASPAARKLVCEVGKDGIVHDLEGLTIYYGEHGGGYLIASVQGANRFYVFERTGDNRLVAIIDQRASEIIGDVEETDGIVVESFGLSAPFERGIFIVHDGVNLPANQNFKLYTWPDVAGSTLIVEPGRDPRQPVWRVR